MTSKDKPGKQKDIDDVLSSIDSLLDTATDVSTDNLPTLELDPDQETDKSQPEEKIEKTIVTNRVSPANKKKTETSTSKTSEASNSKTTEIKEPTILKAAKTAKEQPPATQKPKEPVASSQATKPESEPTVTDKISTPEKEILPEKTEPTKAELKKADTIEKTESKQDFSGTIPTNFSAAQRELPVLDEIITEEEMALIAAGKALPKRIITEKFVPKSTTDKIVDMLAIQLADHDITRLEYEYLHELIDEILVDESNKKPQ